MTCNECRFYDKGICKRYPHCKPKDATDWCGEHKPPKTTHRAAQRPEYSDNFKAFYQAFPRKKEPDAAYKAWKELVAEHHEVHVIEQAKKYAVEKQDCEAKHIKYPASWLRAGGWKENYVDVVDPRDCVLCGAKYGPGHKYTGDKRYKCAKCRNC